MGTICNSTPLFRASSVSMTGEWGGNGEMNFLDAELVCGWVFAAPGAAKPSSEGGESATHIVSYTGEEPGTGGNDAGNLFLHFRGE